MPEPRGPSLKIAEDPGCVTHDEDPNEDSIEQLDDDDIEEDLLDRLPQLPLQTAQLPGLCNLDAPPAAPISREPWPIILLEGAEVAGPFHRPAIDGAPMLEVSHVHVLRDGHVKRGALCARVAYDCDEEQLAAQLGEGYWYISVRGKTGHIIAGRTLRTAQPLGTPPPTKIELASIQPQSDVAALLGAIQAQSQRQTELLMAAFEAQRKAQADLQAQLLKLETEKRDVELASLRDAIRQLPRSGAAQNIDPIEAIMAKLDEATRLKDALTLRLPAPAATEEEGDDEPDGFMAQTMEQAVKMFEMAGQGMETLTEFKEKAKELMSDD